MITTVRRRRLAAVSTLSALWLFVALCAAHPALAQSTDATETQAGPQGLMRWLNPNTAPFLPVPYIDQNPNAGLTIGLLPTKLITDSQDQIREIIAPDVTYNPNFGVGATGRILSYDSEETQWTALLGAKQHVEKTLNVDYQTGRLRDELFTLYGNLVYDRSGTERFYGFGNHSRAANQSNYTFLQKYVQGTVGWNISRSLQISYTLRARSGDVQPGTLNDIPSTNTAFPSLPGLGTEHETLNRLAVIWDSRDDVTLPTRGGRYVIYGGAAARNGVFNASMYTVAGLDGRQIWTVQPGDIIAVHAALRYTPGGSDIPFWALATLGGDASILGEAQPLRGYGAGRYYDRNSFSASIEYRKRVLSLNAVATHINIEVTPFIDAGKVFAKTSESPVTHLHPVAGVGFRGIASPFVVGYVDLGYGSEGAAVFTGVNYPF